MLNLVCRVCGRRADLRSVWKWLRCPRCRGPLDIVYPRSWAPKGRGLSRYSSMLPIEPLLDLGVGGTPTIEALSFGDTKIFFKLEYLNPGGSFKDRGALLALSLIEAVDRDGVAVIEDSSGNTAISLALICRSLGREFVAVIPESAPEGKKKLLQLLGARIISASSRAEATRIARELCKSRGYAYVDHLANPLFIAGAKTIAYEVFEEVGMPDTVIAPVGSGGLFLGLYEGFKDLVELGLTNRIPRFVAVQGIEVMDIGIAAKERGVKVVIEAKCNTSRLADGVRVPKPPRMAQIVEVLAQTKGLVVVLSDFEIAEALVELIDMGFVVEPTSAIAYAALKVLKEKGGQSLGRHVLIPLTGSGYKMVDSLLELRNAFKGD